MAPDDTCMPYSYDIVRLVGELIVHSAARRGARMECTLCPGCYDVTGISTVKAVCYSYLDNS